MFKRISADRLCITLLLCLVTLCHAFTAFEIPLISAIEKSLYDTSLKIHLTDDTDQHVAIANIDEKSIAELGQWPWRRDVLAQMVDTLFDHYQIKALGFDMVFAEASDNTGQEVLQLLANSDLKDNSTFQMAYNALQPQLDFDLAFATSLKGRDVVTGFVFEQTPKDNVNRLPLPIMDLTPEVKRNNSLVEAHSFVANLPLLHEEASYAGFFDNPLLDDDGVFRRVPLLQHIQGYVYPSLALELARLGLGADKIDVHFDRYEQRSFVKSVRLGDRIVPVAENGEILVPYRGYEQSFPYFSVIDIIQQTADLETLKGKVVLLGTDAAGLLDLRTTPFANTYPGVEVHANIVSGIIEDRVMQVPEFALSFEITSIITCTVLLLLIISLRDPRWQIVSVLVLIVGLLVLSQVFWNKGFVMPLASSLLLTIVLFVTLTVINMMTEARQKLSIVKMFGQYVPPELVAQMSREPEKYHLENTNKELTVLFSDIRSFTTISESLSPDELSDLMNQYLTAMTTVIHRHNGTIDKYMGDAIMAFWGAPIDTEEHALLAARAAMDMADELTKLNVDFTARGWPEIKIGIGLNTDTMFVGNMGSEFRMAYTVMGDSVNLGSRLEALTKQYGVFCLVGPKTAQHLAENEFSLRQVDFVKVKGKNEPVAIFHIDKEIEPELNSNFAQFLDAYKQQNWTVALDFIKRFKQENSINEILLTMYEDRIRHFQQYPPGDGWDGVFVHTSK